MADRISAQLETSSSIPILWHSNCTRAPYAERQDLEEAVARTFRFRESRVIGSVDHCAFPLRELGINC